MDNLENISAWFRDAATRHPDILHTEAKPRYYELEWDEMMAAGQPIAAKDFTLVLEDYVENVRDNGGDYLSTLQDLAFMVVKHVPRNAKASVKREMFNRTKLIAKSIVAKLKADELDACDADVPAGVAPPRYVDLSTVTYMPVMPSFFDHAVGCRVTVKIRTDDELEFRRDEVEWVALES